MDSTGSLPKQPNWDVFSEYMAAIHVLADVRTFETDPYVAKMRAKLVRGESGEKLPYDAVRALEVDGIAKVIQTRFKVSPRHKESAFQASCSTCQLFNHSLYWHRIIDRRSRTGSITLVPKHIDDPYHAFLLSNLDWVHQGDTYELDRSGKAASSNAYLCPASAYLQYILRSTPVEDWAAAATTTNPNESPLAFAWAWARANPNIGRCTADVIALVTMGRHLHRLMVWKEEAIEAKIRFATKQRQSTFKYWFSEQIKKALESCNIASTQKVRQTFLFGVEYQNILEKLDSEKIDSEKHRDVLLNKSESLVQAGKRYAELLNKSVGPLEREAVVDNIRNTAISVLEMVEPPVPQGVLLVCRTLAISTPDSCLV